MLYGNIADIALDISAFGGKHLWEFWWNSNVPCNYRSSFACFSRQALLWALCGSLSGNLMWRYGLQIAVSVKIHHFTSIWIFAGIFILILKRSDTYVQYMMFYVNSTAKFCLHCKKNSKDMDTPVGFTDRLMGRKHHPACINILHTYPYCVQEGNIQNMLLRKEVTYPYETEYLDSRDKKQVALAWLH